MLIYLDLLFILNLWIDFLLLIGTNYILKYRVDYKRTIISSIIGALSTFCIFINNNYILIIMKIIIATVMQLTMNGYKGYKTLFENTFYFYLLNITLAGFLYLLKIDSLSLKENYILLFFITPLILYINNKKIKKLDTYYKDVYKVTIILNKKKYNMNAFLDTGNNLYDQYKKRPISIVYNKKIKFDYQKGILVPIETANKKSMMKCLVVDQLIIDNRIIKNALIGLSDNDINIQDINMILHKDIIGGIK